MEIIMGKRFLWMIRYSILGVLAFLVIWPLWFLVMESITSEEELLRTIGPVFGMGQGYAFLPLLPSWPTLEPIVELVLDTPEFFVVFWNTCRLAIPQVFGQIFVGVPAAWAISRLKFGGRKLLYFLYITLMLLPFQVTMVPNYLVLDQLNLLDTVWAILLPGIFSTFPVFIMIKGFDAVPIPLLEAAHIDGSNHLQTMWYIGIPMGIPGILAAAVLGFLEAWNMIEQPMLFLEDQSLWPLSLYLISINHTNLSFGVVASFIMLVPALFVFLFGQKYLELGIQSEGIKG